MSNANLVLGSNLSLRPNQSPSLFARLSDAVLAPLRTWLDTLEIGDRQLAQFLYNAIPGACPFERDVFLFGRKVAHIPPLCKLNPLYDQFVGLRFRSMCYLVDVCGEAL